MKRILLVTAVITAILSCLNTKAQDYLEPDDRFLSKDKGGNRPDEYSSELKQYLFPQEWSIGYLSVPSFSEEYGIFLIWDSSAPMLVYNRFNGNYWYSRNSLKEKEMQITISSDTIRISKEEADRLTGIITDAINKAVKPDGLGRLGFDGIKYYFMLPEKMAKIWSPKKDSECNKLVNEFERLKELFPDEQRRMHAMLMNHRNHCIFRLGAGYTTQNTSSPLSSGIGQLSYCNFMGDFRYRRLYAGINITRFQGVLKTDNFYYDTKENYQWKCGENILFDSPTIRAGYSLIERGRFRITPFVGLGPSSLTQWTGIKNDKDQEIKSKIEGNRVETGIFVDFRVWDFYYLLNGIELSAGLYATRDKLGSLDPMYSLNTCISLHLAFEPD